MIPNSMYVSDLSLTRVQAELLADRAVQTAKTLAPKSTGESALDLRPLAGEGYFGIQWTLNRVWFQEAGINPFTNRAIAGKTIPMWIDDPTGEEQQKNPRAETRTTISGKAQVLIFRRAARMGQRKTVERDGQMVDVPASYPGAPGRIAMRQVDTGPGKVAGQIAHFNVGVRWRHPGLAPRGFLHRSIVQAAEDLGIPVGKVEVAVL